MPKTKRGKKGKMGKRQPKKTNILKANISTPKLRGKGGFVADIGKSAGGWLGSKAADLFTKLTGIGGYSVASNTITNPSNPPILSNTRGATRVQHREYIGEVFSTTGFTLSSYPINPGMGVTFPWLSAVAASYEQYRMHGVVFEYKSTSAVALNSTNTALGTVIMITEYDATKPVFTDKRSMENYVYCVSCPPSVSAMHPVECARQANVLDDLYVRSGTLASSSDLRFSDLGTFQIATVGMQQAGVIIGELWVTFDIELIKPRLPTSITSNPNTHYIYDGTLYPGAGVPTAANLFGTTSAQKFTLKGNGASSVVISGNLIQFPAAGSYVIYLGLAGSVANTISTATAAFQSGTAYGIGTIGNYFWTGAGTQNGVTQWPAAGVSVTTMAIGIFVNVSSASVATPATLLISITTIPGSIGAADLTILSVPSGYTTPFRRSSVDYINQRLRALEIAMEEKENYLVAPPTTPIPPPRLRLY